MNTAKLRELLEGCEPLLSGNLANHPVRGDSGHRIVGFKVPADVAGLSDGLFMADRLRDIAVALPALLDEVERQAGRIEELEMEARVFDEEHVDQNRMVDRIADLIGIPHDQELTSTAFEIWFSALGDKS